MSLGRDLSTIRREKNLTLEDVHLISKIPVHTLESIEKDNFLNQTRENKTYLRSFVRSYAKALKISDEHILLAIDATEAGTYNNDLIKLIHPEIAQEEFSVKKDQVEVTDLDDSTEDNEEEDEIIEETTKTSSTKKERDPKPTIDPTRARFHQVTPTIDSINWGEMSRKIYFNKNNSKTFLVIFFAIVIIGGAFAIYYNLENIKGLFDSEGNQTENTISSKADTEPIVPSPIDTTLEAKIEEPAVAFIDEPTTQMDRSSDDLFGDTLKIVLYAAYDKLDPVRVTSDFNGRTNPFWLDAGQASYFQFRDTLLIRGQYSKMLLLFNNHVIENPRQNYFNTETNSIMLTRNMLEDAKYRDAVGPGYPQNVLPPDSIEYLIRY